MFCFLGEDTLNPDLWWSFISPSGCETDHIFFFLRETTIKDNQ